MTIQGICILSCHFYEIDVLCSTPWDESGYHVVVHIFDPAGIFIPAIPVELTN